LEKRLEAVGAAMVKSIKELTNNEILKMWIAPANKIGQKRLKTFRNLATAVIPGPPPEKVNYCKFNNPYLAKYGEVVTKCEPEWKTQIQNAPK
jgi:hypothetical protein